LLIRISGNLTAGYFLFTNLAKKKAYRSPHY